MAREVDPNSKNLSDDDKAYLAQRGLLPASVMSVEDQRKLLDPDTISLDDRANTGDVNTANLTVEQLEELLAAKRAEAEAVKPKTLFSDESAEGNSDDDEDDEPLEPPYDQYTNPQLRAEIERRNEDRDEDEKLALTGTKPDLVTRLTEDDEADDEDDEE